MTGYLTQNILLFGRVLRGLGLDINPNRMIDLMRSLEYINIGEKHDFYHTARCLLVHQQDHLPLFDQAFEIFWQAYTEHDFIYVDGNKTKDKKLSYTPPPLKPPDSIDNKNSSKQQPDPNQPPVIELTLTYSQREVLRRKDFSEMTEEEIKTVKNLMAKLIWQIDQRQSRRQQPGSGKFLDLRRTFRNSLHHDGEILKWAKQRSKIKPRPVVIIADVSGSMERYTRLLLHFVYSIAMKLEQRVEVFVFSTRLTRIARQLKNRNIEQAITAVSKKVPDWSGGTRIGEAIKTFNFDWGRRVLSGGAVVLFISDGWDRGDPGLLSKEMARLQRSCHRLIWLNPLLGSPKYEPLTRGTQAAIGYVDDFLPVHNLASLEELAEHLSKLDKKRQIRRESFYLRT